MDNFRSTPFSQFRRAVVICSNEDDRIQSIQHMRKKFMDSGYKKDEIDIAQKKALLLCRKEILGTSSRPTGPQSIDQRQLTFVMNRKKQPHVQTYKEDIDRKQT